MAKALIIKNADFSANKVTTVTFNDIACTGVSFTSDSVTLDSVGSAVIGYTITPENTTDTVIWQSSDPSVVSVSNGVFTANGIGTCTLTLQCGSFSATCSVTVDIYETPIYLNGYIDEATHPSDSSVTGIYCTGGSALGVVCVGDYSDGFFTESLYHKNQRFDVGDITAIKIPDNTQSIHVHATDVYGNALLYFIDASESFIKGDNKCVPVISKVSVAYTSSDGVKSIDTNVAVPEGATGYALFVRPKTSSVMETITSESALKEYAEETLALSIHYLDT